MTTDRPYRTHMSSDDAVAELQRASGSQFDPDVVAAFMRLYESGAVLPLG
jgi:HD-GYP domain-containing protein (c-di-GMP phosphodiesterase class II)